MFEKVTRRVSPSREDYLKEIWTLSERSEPVSHVATGELAKKLKVSMPAVSKMLKHMEQQSLISYTPYYGVRLNETGRSIALGMVRRHRLLELFLAKVMGYSDDQVHKEAEHLEHHISPEFERRIDKILGFPKHCPHGSPIPRDDGSFQ